MGLSVSPGQKNELVSLVGTGKGIDRARGDHIRGQFYPGNNADPSIACSASLTFTALI